MSLEIGKIKIEDSEINMSGSRVLEIKMHADFECVTQVINRKDALLIINCLQREFDIKLPQ